jgi:hypothetical protein
MKKSRAMLLEGFESSTGLTPEFAQFYRTFKSEFTKELKSIGATNIVFSRGHFYVSGFFTVNGQAYYFSLSDVRGMDYSLRNNPDSCMSQLLYRTAQHYKDYTGGMNQYVRIGQGMAQEMRLR